VDNAEVVRRGFEALGEGGVEALLELVDEEFEFTTPPDMSAEPDTYRGHEGLRRYFDSFYDAMEEIRFEPQQFIAVGERVVVPFRLTARGRTTGIEVEQRAVFVWEVRDGVAVGLKLFTDVEEATAAARS
jgi:ketosteroid isomerase-like protein